MVSNSRKRARRGPSGFHNVGKPSRGSLGPTNKTHAGPSSRRGEGGQKILHSLSLPTLAETPVVADSDRDRQQGYSSNNLEDAVRLSKKARLESEYSHDVSTSTMPESPIFKIPPEILGEILVLTDSPRHVLAFARTCKYFCYTLIGDGAQYIWRQARRGPQCSFLEFENQIHLGIGITWLPDPPKEFFSEAAYAAFLFDPGACDNCGKQTFVPYESFALRIRFCNNPSCRRLPAGLQDPQQFELIVPTNERSDITAQGSHVTYWPFPPSDSHETLSRETDIAKVCDEFLSQSDGNEKRLESLRSRNTKWMHFCSALAKWKAAFIGKYNRVRAANEAVVRHAADIFGCEYTDIMGCTVVGSFCQQQSKFLEKVDIQDVFRLRDQIESELLSLEEKRQRRKTETALMKNRADVETLYNRLRSKSAYENLPSLPTFRQLPIIQLLQAGIYDEKCGTKIADTLQNNQLMRQRLDQEVQRWIDTATQDLAVVLGFPRQWKSANKNILHPVKRSTAWFLCTKCNSDGTDYIMDGSLSFADACLHVCQGKNGKNDRFRRSKKAAWNPENFIKDEKAINVMKSALVKLQLSEETTAKFPFLKHPFVGVICHSCETSMVLDSRSMIGHSHRHETMELSYVSHEEVASYLNGFAYSYGIVSKFFRRGGQTTKREIDKKNFGCRICLRKKQAKDTAAIPGGSRNAIGSKGGRDPIMGHPVFIQYCSSGQKPQEMPPLFSFNGMRSHLKAKHGMEKIRDEDFFCSESVKL